MHLLSNGISPHMILEHGATGETHGALNLYAR
jgi:hypothetical protein